MYGVGLLLPLLLHAQSFQKRHDGTTATTFIVIISLIKSRLNIKSSSLPIASKFQFEDFVLNMKVYQFMGTKKRVRHVIEKKLKLTAKLKEANFSDIAQKKMAYIFRSTDFSLFLSKTP